MKILVFELIFNVNNCFEEISVLKPFDLSKRWEKLEIFGGKSGRSKSCANICFREFVESRKIHQKLTKVLR